MTATIDQNRAAGSERIEELLGQLCDLETSERSALLDEISAGDPHLRDHVKALLDNYDSARKFFDQFPDLLRVVSDAHPSRTFEDGEIVASRFRINGLLGQGGVGEVYDAEDLELHEPVALKTLRASLAADETLIERLGQELRLARRISHPNVCRVYDLFEHRTSSGGRVSVFAMEKLEGETLAARLQRGAIPPRDALPIVRQVADAIDAAHAASVAHGDLKPGNIMLVPSPDGTERVVVTDFGLARWLPSETTLVTATTESRRWGTPIYMAPEQLMGGRITRASDIYSLGVVCYEMVTGQQPFAREAPMLLAVRKLRHIPRPPRELVPELDPRWQSAILRCLDADPERRFRYARDLVTGIEHGRTRRPWLIAAAVAAALLVAWIATRVIEPGAAASSTSATQAVAERIVAVLPFTQDMPTDDGTALALGLTAALTDHLASLSNAQPGLHVIPVEEVITTGVNTPALAQQTLGASLFVAGRLNMVGDRTEIAIGLNELSDEGFRLKDSRTVSIRSRDPSVLDPVMVAAMQLLAIPQQRMRPPPWRETQQPEAEASYLRGRGHLAQGQSHVTAAIDAFQRAVQRDDQFARAYAGLSEAYRAHYVANRDRQSLQTAQQQIDRAIAIAPRDAQAHVTRGRLYLMSGQYQRAILELTTALELDTNIADGRRWLAAAHQANGEVERAEAMLREAVARHPRHWSSHVHLGVFLYRQGRYREAEESFVKGVAYAPANPEAALDLSAVYLAQGQLAAAEVELAKATRLVQDGRLYNNLAWVYILEGKFGDAVTAMEGAVKQSAADSLVWSSLARAYRWNGGRDADAGAAYRTALERADEEARADPMNAATRSNRAYLMAETGRTEDARREIDVATALESAKANVIVFFNSALVHELAGNRERAIQDLLVAAQRGYSKTVIERHPDLSRLRKDPRFRQVLDVAGKPSA
jgi:tetratricopeptide (TPR) repeat protein